MTSVTHLEVDEIDLSDPGFWMRPDREREDAFATLRAERPVSVFDEPEFDQIPRGPGYWAPTRYEDVWAASRRAGGFHSGKGGNNGDIPVQISQVFGPTISM